DGNGAGTATRGGRAARTRRIELAPTLEPGSRGYVRLRLESPAVLARGDRYILRAYSPPITIAGGPILPPPPPPAAIRNQAALERLQRLDFDPSSADRLAADVRALTAMLDELGSTGMAVEAVTSRAGVEPARVGAVVDALVAAQHAVRAGDSIVSAG